MHQIACVASRYAGTKSCNRSALPLSFAFVFLCEGCIPGSVGESPPPPVPSRPKPRYKRPARQASLPPLYSSSRRKLTRRYTSHHAGGAPSSISLFPCTQMSFLTSCFADQQCSHEHQDWHRPREQWWHHGRSQGSAGRRRPSSPRLERQHQQSPGTSSSPMQSWCLLILSCDAM